MWGDLPPVTVAAPPERLKLKKAAAQVSQVLQEVGENAVALNSLAIEKRRMKPLFKGFNPEQITPKDLNRAGMILYKFGMIDNHTAELMSRAGDEFDKKGKLVDPSKEINALEFFANRIIEMKEKAMSGDPYAKVLLPDYIRTIHIMQNLQTFAESGDSYEMRKIKDMENKGLVKKTPNAKA
ncbi:hypothetical protein ACDH60_24440 [Pseudomonas ficuserectae]|nr:hypothetical protein [Pseudomonas amygdali]KKY56661.1 hypothetical protein AAY85_16555 [Pseudomonas amygdali pv. lachrymans]KPB99593.1 Uncharacterized protein AC501_5445 [Pseudomonas amygdali pv. lachrymans]KPC19295.1 Uncharacterized protein AC499_3742 [Pseudomonas amygdali pv. lachrymans]QWA52739.1 hypothetical protein C4C37_05955 [Pseudomonas amygdali pv. lachrymans]RMM45283.1 hypothetical protein ALQ79_04398 [Pseudomonas amygdali pv. lachrymans]